MCFQKVRFDITFCDISEIQYLRFKNKLSIAFTEKLSDGWIDAGSSLVQ